MWMYDFGGWGMLFGGILMLLFWGGIIALIVWGVTKLTRHDNNTIRSSNPLDLVKERYARGEITKDQFEQLKKDLT